jgi:hypothetical protein
MQHIPPKRWYIFTRLYICIFKKIVLVFNVIENFKSHMKRLYLKLDTLMNSLRIKWFQGNTSVQGKQRVKFRGLVPFISVSFTFYLYILQIVFSWSTRYMNREDTQNQTNFIDMSETLSLHLFWAGIEVKTAVTNRLCGLMVRVSDCRSRGPGFETRPYQIFWEVDKGSGTGSTQPREDNWGATWMKK